MKNFKLAWFVLPLSLSLSLVVACGDDDDGGDDNGNGGAANEAGSPGKAGGSSKAGETGKGGETGGGGDGPMGAQPRGKLNPPTLGAQIDRMGRPAIGTALMETFNGDDDAKGMAKDEYNAAGPDDWADFEEPFQDSLGILDALDATCGNQLLADTGAGDEQYAPLAALLADDQLYVNTDKGECGAYLGVEAEFKGLVPDGTCGGRTPAYDVIETSYSVLAAGVLSGVDDGITEDDAEHDPDTFPFLAEPQ
jgi:hypothetical protein